MTNNIENLSNIFEIHETTEGRFLVDKRAIQKIVLLGDEKIEYLKPKVMTLYDSFKVTGPKGIGLMQLKYTGKVGEFTTVTGVKASNKEIFMIDEVMTIPAIYKSISINHTERFGYRFPLSFKEDDDAVVYYNGEELTNTLGHKVSVCMRENKMLFIPQIISYRRNYEYVVNENNEVIFSTNYSKYPKLSFIKNAAHLASIRPNYEPYKTDIWMYNAKNKVGIIYIDTNGKIKDYHINDIDFSNGNQIYFINEHYIIYENKDKKKLYFDGKYAGSIIYFFTNTKYEYFIQTDSGFYIGKTYFDEKDFGSVKYLNQECFNNINDKKIKICLCSDSKNYYFLLDLTTGNAQTCN